MVQPGASLLPEAAQESRRSGRLDSSQLVGKQASLGRKEDPHKKEQREKRRELQRQEIRRLTLEAARKAELQAMDVQQAFLHAPRPPPGGWGGARIIAEGDPIAVRNDPAVVASYLGTDERAIQRSDS